MTGIQDKNPHLIFDKTVYTGKKNKVLVTCPVHGDYTTSSRLLLSGVNCKKCYHENLRERWSRQGWIEYCEKRNLHTSIFYIIKMTHGDETFIKFGITSTFLKTRLGKYPSQYTIDIINTIEGSPNVIWDMEHYLKSNYKQHRFKPKVKFGGSTQECLNISILNQILNDKTVCCN